MKKLIAMVLTGAMAFASTGCELIAMGLAELEREEETEAKSPTYEIKYHNPLVVERCEYKLTTRSGRTISVKDNCIEWTRYPTCCENLQGYATPPLFWCLTDEYGEVPAKNHFGEELQVINYHDYSIEIISFEDYDCGKVDKIFNFQSKKRHLSRLESRTDELFQEANKRFLEYKNKIREGIDIEQEVQKLFK